MIHAIENAQCFMDKHIETLQHLGKMTVKHQTPVILNSFNRGKQTKNTLIEQCYYVYMMQHAILKQEIFFLNEHVLLSRYAIKLCLDMTLIDSINTARNLALDLCVLHYALPNNHKLILFPSCCVCLLFFHASQHFSTQIELFSIACLNTATLQN